MIFFDGDLDAARAAAERWTSWTERRESNGRKIAAGGIAEVESPERIKLRLDRLSTAATQASTPTPAAAASIAESFSQERMLGRPDFLGINFLEVAIAVARYTGRINIRTGPGRTVGFGTGFTVSPQLILTNHHLLPDKAAATWSEIEFDYQYDRDGRLLPMVPFKLLPETFFMTDAVLDFTLVAVAEISDSGVKARNYGWTQLIGAQGKALIGENVNIVQHPKGEPKQIVMRSNELVDLNEQFAHYVADTEPGSSGSPVYNDQWDPMALHHSGVPKTDGGKLIKKDGHAFVAGDDPNDIEWVANEGVRVSSLVDFIQKQTLSPAEARLRDDLLNLSPMAPLEAAQAVIDATKPRPVIVPGLPDAVAVAPVAGTAPAVGGSVTWTIPLTVTVQVGAPIQGGTPSVAVSVAATPEPVSLAATGPVPSATAAAAPPVPPPAAISPAPEPAKSLAKPAALVAALAEAGKAAERPYYDPAHDKAVRHAYYAQLSPPIAGLPPADAFAALAALLERTHSTRLPYQPAVELYPWVDLQEAEGGAAPMLTSIYSGKPFAAAELIEADFAVDAARAERALSAPQESVDAVEAALPYNCEHVVCQSWFDKREPMRGDLHHLFACEPDCNSFRGNTPYFDFPPTQEAVRGACGRREDDKFEPGAGKGAVARATLYFLLRYPGRITTARYTAERLGVLLDWHKGEPVSRWEHHRNVAIHAAQGNRNPLIDFPAWAAHIDFTKGLGAG